MMLQHEPEDRPTADQLLRLPILRPHIARYEQMALKLIEAKQAKKTGVSVNIPSRCSCKNNKLFPGMLFRQFEMVIYLLDYISNPIACRGGTNRENTCRVSGT